MRLDCCRHFLQVNYHYICTVHGCERSSSVPSACMYIHTQHGNEYKCMAGNEYKCMAGNEMETIALVVTRLT